MSCRLSLPHLATKGCSCRHIADVRQFLELQRVFSFGTILLFSYQPFVYTFKFIQLLIISKSIQVWWDCQAKDNLPQLDPAPFGGFSMKFPVSKPISKRGKRMGCIIICAPNYPASEVRNLRNLRNLKGKPSVVRVLVIVVVTELVVVVVVGVGIRSSSSFIIIYLLQAIIFLPREQKSSHLCLRLSQSCCWGG